MWHVFHTCLTYSFIAISSTRSVNVSRSKRHVTVTAMNKARDAATKFTSIFSGMLFFRSYQLGCLLNNLLLWIKTFQFLLVFMRCEEV
jgi:phosphatidylglycerophosphate synthase